VGANISLRFGIGYRQLGASRGTQITKARTGTEKR
jgi:hypothetical protein